jgi:predicted phosphodiesterase
MLGILQLSDIHFARERESVFNVDRELQNGVLRFVPTILERCGPIGLIVICGDVAYHGLTKEYATALGFLRELRSALGNPEIPVRVVPGNHDVFRPATDDATQRFMRSSVRRAPLTADERAQELERILSTPSDGVALLECLDAYNDFAGAFDCEIAPMLPHWESRFVIVPGWDLCLRGLTSVLVSDATDETDRVVLGLFQVADLATQPGCVNMTLCHHPYCWLLDGTESRQRISNRSQIHITGHVHRHDLRATDEHVHLLTGALQPPRSGEDAWDPRFNALKLDVTGLPATPELSIDLLAAKWDSEKDRFVAEEANCTHASIKLAPLPEPPPARATETDVSLTRLTERLALLPFADQADVAAAIGLDLADVLRRPAHEIVRCVMDRAESDGKLQKLWNLVQERHGGQAAGDNPFI